MEPNIRNLTEAEFRKNMLVLIGKTHLNCGFKLDENQIGLTVDELCSDLKKYNGLLSFQEIQIAFNNGYKKQYGDFFGLNNATYFVWVNAYTWNQSRLNAKKAIENAKNPIAKPQPSQEEKERIVKEGVLKMFEDYKKGGNILDSGNVSYNFLNGAGLLKPTIEKKMEYMDQAKAELRNEAINNKGNRPLSKVLEDVLQDELVTSRAKRLALKEYFDGLIEFETELSDELKSNITL